MGRAVKLWSVVVLVAGCGGGGGGSTADAAEDPPPDAAGPAIDAVVDVFSPDGEYPCGKDTDFDNDGVPDAIEGCDEDWDGDGLPDYQDSDSDDDGLSDGEEDRDGDGVLDYFESSPHDVDTDDDGYTDPYEVAAGTNPSDPFDNPAYLPLVELAITESAQLQITFELSGDSDTVIDIVLNPHGFVTAMEHVVTTAVATTWRFTLTNADVACLPGHDQVFRIQLELVNSSGTTIDSKGILVIVPECP